MAFYRIAFGQQRGKQSIDLNSINTVDIRFKNIGRDIQSVRRAEDNLTFSFFVGKQAQQFSFYTKRSAVNRKVGGSSPPGLARRKLFHYLNFIISVILLVLLPP